jgi:adenylate cyclase
MITRLTLVERRLRIITGLILATYITIHLSNHALGLISLEAMEAMRQFVTPFWRSWPGSLLLYSSILIHAGLAFMSLYRRTTLRLPLWELGQLVLGLSIVPLLAGHVAGTWGARILMDININYDYALNGILSNNWILFKQALLVIVAWSHAVIGLHFFLRLFAWYRRWYRHLYPLVIILPLLVFLSMIRMGVELEIWQQQDEPAPYTDRYRDYNEVEADEIEVEEPLVKPANLVFRDSVLMIFYLLLFITLAARALRDGSHIKTGTVVVKHENGRVLKGVPGQTILEIIRKHSIPHASLCGGRGRCTTCRVRVGEGCSELEAPSPLEQHALNRIGAAPNVRLACQTRPLQSVHVTPLLPPDLGADSNIPRGGVSGEEREVVAMFVDLRGSTRMGELLLPYDVLFILNRFFVEMSEALTDSHGHYAQFAGDGLMALYGLERGLKQGCLDALQGAVGMQERMNQLNEKLIDELKEPLGIGIGIHCGEAIVGTMGPPKSPNYSAIGDCINAAARLEGKSKELGCTLVVSNQVVLTAGLVLNRFPTQTVNLRGKQQSISVHVIENPLELSNSLDSVSNSMH